MKYGYTYDKETNTVSKTAERSKHFFKLFEGWAVDEHILRKYPLSMVRINDIENGFSYTVGAQTMLQTGKKVDFGHGAQVVLPATEWKLQ